jgi:hypothetical protein
MIVNVPLILCFASGHLKSCHAKADKLLCPSKLTAAKILGFLENFQHFKLTW